MKKLDVDIVLPNLRIKSTNNTNIVKLITNQKNEDLYFKSYIPYQFKKDSKYHKKTSFSGLV